MGTRRYTGMLLFKEKAVNPPVDFTLHTGEELDADIDAAIREYAESLAWREGFDGWEGDIILAALYSEDGTEARAITFDELNALVG